MLRIARSRVRHLEQLANVDGPPIGRLLFLIPDLWPEQDRAAFEDSDLSLEALRELVERRTGVRSTFGMDGFWAIPIPASDELLAMSDEQKAAFMEAHESRPLAPNHWGWRGDAAGDAAGAAGSGAGAR